MTETSPPSSITRGMVLALPNHTSERKTLMDAEHRFIVVLALLCVSLLSIVAIILFVALWAYGLIIGFVLVGLVSLLVLLLCGVTINEQILRHRRVKYQQELP